MDYIPILDLSTIVTEKVGDPEIVRFSQDTHHKWQNIADKLAEALHGIGFVYLKNHGLSQSVIDDGFSVGKRFFDLPHPCKMKYKKKPSTVSSSYGWVQAGEELLHADSSYEIRECFDYLHESQPSIEEVPELTGKLQYFQNECNELIKKLLFLLGLALKLEDPYYFLNTCRHLEDPRIENECDFRLLYYPSIPNDLEIKEGTVRCAEHTDYEILTLLFQDDVGGLQVKSSGGEWIPAKPMTGTILINTGDLLELWTNGYFPATIHRVVIPREEIYRKIKRYSIAYFFAPDNLTPINVIQSPIILSNTCGNRNEIEEVCTAGEHIMRKIKAAYNY